MALCKKLACFCTDRRGCAQHWPHLAKKSVGVPTPAPAPAPVPVLQARAPVRASKKAVTVAPSTAKPRTREGGKTATSAPASRRPPKSRAVEPKKVAKVAAATTTKASKKRKAVSYPVSDHDDTDKESTQLHNGPKRRKTLPHPDLPLPSIEVDDHGETSKAPTSTTQLSTPPSSGTSSRSTRTVSAIETTAVRPHTKGIAIPKAGSKKRRASTKRSPSHKQRVSRFFLS